MISSFPCFQVPFAITCCNLFIYFPNFFFCISAPKTIEDFFYIVLSTFFEGQQQVVVLKFKFMFSRHTIFQLEPVEGVQEVCVCLGV